MAMIQIVSTLCRMCEQGCGIDVEVKDGRPVKIKGSKEHPFNKGWLCPKGQAALELFYSPQRLASPLIRKKGDLKEVNWDEALDFVAEKLHQIKHRYGAQSLAIYHGEGFGHQEIKYYMKRFANVYGTPNFTGVGSICNASKTLGEKLTFGGLTKPDIQNTSFMIVWGANPVVSHEPFPPADLVRFKKRGGKLVVVDPRMTETASKADFHLFVRPGSDDVLILNMFHVLFKEDLWDKRFAGEWIQNFAHFYKTLKSSKFSPENGEPFTGVSPETVRLIARQFASHKPACILTGNGLEHHSFGLNTARLLAILKAVSGNLDIPGGDLFSIRPKLKDITTPLPWPEVRAIGSKRFPLICRDRKEGQALCLPEAILEECPYPIKGMIIAGGNPSLEWPDSMRTQRAFQKLEFLLVIDVVKSPDHRYADVVLPACTFLERDEHRVNVYQNLQYITIRRKVVEPVYGLADQMIWIKLAHKMGLGKYFPWESCKQGIDYILSEQRIDYDHLTQFKGGYEYKEREYKKYEHNGFNTPTGKVEIYPDDLKNLGFYSSPIKMDNHLPYEQELDFPLFLTTGANLPVYTHWQFRYISKLKKKAPEPVFEISLETASHYGLLEGDLAEVQTRYGKIKLKAHLTNAVCPNTIHIPQGWEEGNCNELTSVQDVDPISGFPNLKSLGCRVNKV